MAFATETAVAAGRTREDMLDVQKALLDFDAVAGTVFADATALAADMASTFGRDLAGEATALGSTIQDLAEGKVEGLRKNFGFLDDAMLGNIETMVDAGDRYGAVTTLIKALEASIGNAAESGEGSGATGAFNRMKIAGIAALDALIEREPFIQNLATDMEMLAEAIEWVNEKFGQIKPISSLSADQISSRILELRSEQTAAEGRLAAIDANLARRGQTVVSKGVAAERERELKIIWETKSVINDLIEAGDKQVEQERERARLAKQAIENTKVEAEARDKATKSSSRGRSEAERAADEQERRTKALDEEIRRTEQAVQLEGAKGTELEYQVALANDIADIEVKYAGLAADKIAALKAATTELAEQKRLTAEIKEIEAGEKNAQRVAAQARKELERQHKENARIAEREFDNLADIYERAFRDGTGSIWDQFKSLGTRAIAEVLAAWTLGGTGGAGTLLGSLGLGGGSGGNLGVDFGGLFGNGGIMNLLGGGGQSFNMIQSSQLPGGGAGAGGLGGALSSVGPALGAFGLAVGVNQIVGDIFGFKGGPLGILTGPLKSILSPNRTSNAILTGTGTPTTGGKGSKQDVALGLAGNVQDSLSQIAEALGVDVGSFYTSIGVRGGDYRVNTGGSSLKIKNGAKNFGDDAEAAIEYALRDAIGDGAFTGKISAAAERALRNTSKSIEDAIEDALTIESIPKRLREIEDPIGAAVDKVVEDFTKLRDTMVANGATAQQLADAEKLFSYEREAAIERTETTLRDFLEGLKVGGNSPLSLRDQSATAEAAFAKYEADIAAGKAVDQAGFAEASQAALDIKRQTDGSTQGYFDLYNRVVSAGNAAQGRIDSTGASRNDANPFAKPTAEAAAETANNTATLPAILNQLQQIAGQLSKVGGGGLAYGNFGFVR